MDRKARPGERWRRSDLELAAGVRQRFYPRFSFVAERGDPSDFDDRATGKRHIRN